MWRVLVIAALLGSGCAAVPAPEAADPGCAPTRETDVRPTETVTFPSAALSLRAQVFRPCGRGPYPVVIYAHGGEEDPTSLFDVVGPALASRGVIVFAPHRRGAGLSADQGPELFATLEAIGEREGPDARARAAVAALEGPHLDDIAAAITASRRLAGADPERTYLIGNGFGGVLAMLAAERGLGLKGVANFAGAAANWGRSAIFRERLLRAAESAIIPIYVAQAANDYSVERTLRLGHALAAAGKSHRARVWPAFGSTSDDGHGFGVFGARIWAAEVLQFFGDPPAASREDR